MNPSAFAILCQGNDQCRPESMEELLSGMVFMLPLFDAIPNAAIFIKDLQARYLLADWTSTDTPARPMISPRRLYSGRLWVRHQPGSREPYRCNSS